MVALLNVAEGVQTNDVPPVAKSVVFEPLQIAGLPLLAVTRSPLTNTETVSVAEHPFASVPTTV